VSSAMMYEKLSPCCWTCLKNMDFNQNGFQFKI
jgi:hypothetical protein